MPLSKGLLTLLSRHWIANWQRKGSVFYSSSNLSKTQHKLNAYWMAEWERIFPCRALQQWEPGYVFSSSEKIWFIGSGDSSLESGAPSCVCTVGGVCVWERDVLKGWRRQDEQNICFISPFYVHSNSSQCCSNTKFQKHQLVAPKIT